MSVGFLLQEWLFTRMFVCCCCNLMLFLMIGVNVWWVYLAPPFLVQLCWHLAIKLHCFWCLLSCQETHAAPQTYPGFEPRPGSPVARYFSRDSRRATNVPRIWTTARKSCTWSLFKRLTPRHKHTQDLSHGQEVLYHPFYYFDVTAVGNCGR